jgi:hypothetical protein
VRISAGGGFGGFGGETPMAGEEEDAADDGMDEVFLLPGACSPGLFQFLCGICRRVRHLPLCHISHMHD